ncbi:SLAP domain-containing protein [Salinibacillus kushneri]|uniref:SLAP domain-containing protein n=1 Tax=Salinibacillus kushneri TaxID=237682 RepID=A0A1I0GRC2_9BACI|nr:SLAP domain-containing protein [Salinibacillus kushneri]SET73919.1 SLAP domain-containing protein [Salinibacillus kushneri]
MQKNQSLNYESSWDKTLSEKDRAFIQHVFQETQYSKDPFITLWEAINHQSDLLVTVLIQNHGSSILTFQNQKLRYLDQTRIIAENTFTIPALVIEPYTSMPWTFIFPHGSYDEEAGTVPVNAKIVAVYEEDD